jgi:carboxypeptidase D
MGREHLCGYDLSLRYPQTVPFPTLTDPYTTTSTSHPLFAHPSLERRLNARYSWKTAILDRYFAQRGHSALTKRDLDIREEDRQVWKRDISQRPNNTPAPSYGCFLFAEMVDYAANFSFPWSKFCHADRFSLDWCSIALGGFDVQLAHSFPNSLHKPYDIPDALNPEAPSDPIVFLNGEGSPSLRILVYFGW